MARVRDGVEEGTCDDQGAIEGDLHGDGIVLSFNCGHTNQHVDKVA